MELALLSVVAFFYLLATIWLVNYLKNLQQAQLKASRIFLGTALFLQWSLFIYELGEMSSLEKIGALTTVVAFGVLAGLSVFILIMKKKALPVVALATPLIALAQVGVLFVGGETRSLSLPSVWLWTHIALMVIGEVLFFFSAVTGLVYWISNRQLKKKRPSSFFANYSLPGLDALLGRLILLGVISLSLGIALGTFFAGKFWEGQWWFDGKILLTLFTWLVYLGMIALRRLDRSFHGERSAMAAIIGFVAVVFLSIGVDALFNTKHSELRTSQVEDKQ